MLRQGPVRHAAGDPPVQPGRHAVGVADNLEGDARFTAEAVTALYFRRWCVETHYRDEKTSMAVETFHSQTENGIRQELFAILVMAVIARLLSRLAANPGHPSRAEPQFKHALLTLACAAALLPFAIFAEVLDEIARVRYYRPKTPRPPATPRVEAARQQMAGR